MSILKQNILHWHIPHDHNFKNAFRLIVSKARKFLNDYQDDATFYTTNPAELALAATRLSFQLFQLPITDFPPNIRSVYPILLGRPFPCKEDGTNIYNAMYKFFLGYNFDIANQPVKEEREIFSS